MPQADCYRAKHYGESCKDHGAESCACSCHQPRVTIGERFDDPLYGHLVACDMCTAHVEAEDLTAFEEEGQTWNFCKACYARSFNADKRALVTANNFEGFWRIGYICRNDECHAIIAHGIEAAYSIDGIHAITNEVTHVACKQCQTISAVVPFPWVSNLPNDQ